MKKKEKDYEVYIDFDVLEAYEDLFLMLENLRSDLKKSTLKGSRTSGIRARHGLKAAQQLLKTILKNSLPAERAAKAAQKPHGNKLDPVGIKVMLEKRKIQLKGK